MADTLNELAKKLKVSRRTLSRVLKDDKDVSEETKTKVKSFLEKQRIYPNFHAALLASKKRAKIIGLIFPRGSFLKADHYVIETLRGVSQAAQEEGFEVMFYSHEGLEASTCIKLYKSRLVGGLVLTAVAKNDLGAAQSMKREKVPFVMINSYCDKIDSISCDGKMGGYTATKYLADKGRKKIAFLHGHKNWIDAIDRFEGYKKALKEAKITFNRNYVEFSYFDFEPAELATERLLGLRNPPDAIFAANDNMAIGAINTIRRAKLKIPKDIAVVGFDDIPACKHFNPPITTVSHPLREIAMLGTNRLIQIISEDRKTPPLTKFLEPRLVVRKSA